jgi:DNA-binding response OmpR family regulator
MKKVLIAKELNALAALRNSFLSRSDIQVFAAGTTDEMVALHRRNVVDLIIVPLDLPGSLGMEQACATLQADPLLGAARLLLVCPNRRDAIEQASRCRPKAVVLRPVNPGVLLARAQQFLDLASRETYRVLINVSVDTAGRDNHTFFCRSHDISATGMMIETDRALEQGARITCAFFLPDASRFQAPAEVVRTVTQDSKDGLRRYGLRFLQLGPQERKALDDFVKLKAAAPPAL